MEENYRVREAYFATNMYHYHGRSGSYRISRWAPPEPVEFDDLAPSQLLDVRNKVVPFHGRTEVLDRLGAWRDDSGRRSALLIHAPGGYGKTRLAEKFATDSAAAGWRVATAYADNTRHDPRLDLHKLDDAPGLLVVVDYAERWPAETLLDCLARLAGAESRAVRVLLLARPGAWWEDVRHTVVDIQRYREAEIRLEAVAAGPAARRRVFDSARDCFAKAMRVADAGTIVPPMSLEDSKFDSILDIHMSALVAVDAARQPSEPSHALGDLSDYLLRREQQHWADMHAKGRIGTRKQMMRRVVFVATLTGPVTPDEALIVLRAAGLAESVGDGSALLEDHRLCYPPLRPGIELTPLYPDRLAEDFIALLLTDPSWAGTVPLKLPETHRPRIFTMLSEASQRYAHIDPAVLLQVRPESVAAGRTPVAATGALDTFRGAVLAMLPLAPTMRETAEALFNPDPGRPVRQWPDYARQSAVLAGHLLDAVPRVASLTGRRRLRALQAVITINAARAVLGALGASLPTGSYRDLVTAGDVFANFADLRLQDLELPLEQGLDLVNQRRLLREAVLMVLAALAPYLEPTRIVDLAVERYADGYAELATTLPEFVLWQQLADHRETAAVIGESADRVMEALNALPEGTLDPPETTLASPPPKLVALARANRAALQQPIIPADAAVATLTLESSYIAPRFRFSVLRSDQPVGEEAWWLDQRVYRELDQFLSGHLSSPSAITHPLLILGAPGSGKSSLLKVVAARLPADNFTTVRIPMRTVHADAPVYRQVQEALDYTTAGRITWAELAVYGDTTLRVLLFDGLDEMVASGAERLDYLRELGEFQQREAELGRPVAVIVTSRVVVAARLRLPDETLVVRLEPFDEEQTARWLGTWNRASAQAIAAGNQRTVTMGMVLRHANLTGSPLLLLLLTLYLAGERAEEPASQASLYHRLVDAMIRREREAINADTSIEEELWWLGILAFAGFNRDRHLVTDQEIANDLAAWGVKGTAVPALLARSPLIHTSSSVYSGGQRRSYEFLHATFGEYLVAEHLLRILIEMASVPPGRWSGHSFGVLRALLTHQPLSVRVPILTMITELAATLPPDEHARIAAVLQTALLDAACPYSGDEYSAYQPTPPRVLPRFAAYTANLVLLRIALGPLAGVALAELVAPGTDPLEAWRSTVRAWGAGLPRDSWTTVIHQLELAGDRVLWRPDRWPADDPWVLEAELCGATDLAQALRRGLGA